MKLIFLITANVEQGMEVAQVWQEVGAPGVTIIRTHGLHSLQQTVQKGHVELPLVMSSMATAMAHIIKSMDAPGQLLLSVVDDAMVERLQQSAETILGDMRKPNNGIMIVLDIESAIGVHHHTQQTES